MQAIPYFLKDTTNSWYQSLVNKPQDFNAFKVEFLRYFSNNNSINCLVNTFTTMKQGETETYPNQNQPAYLPVTQSSVYQSLVYQAPIYQPQPQVIYQQPQPQIIYQSQQIQTPLQSLPSNGTQRLRMTQQSWRSTMVVHQLISSSSQQPSGLCQQNSGAGQPQNLNSQNYLSLLITPEDTSTNNLAFAQKQPLTSNIPSATITENESLAAIFPFKFKETTTTLLFSGAALEAKPITMMYTNAKVEGQSIKLILDSGSAGSIIT
ncbi:hypothetical protein G9A89_001483 [Geosiphon pyriformis]|nr:hypothetical protein G9A89_001483 [Geosiphon pyriformis]